MPRLPSSGPRLSVRSRACAGDCLQAGYDPPQSVAVLLDSELAESAADSSPPPLPPLAKPPRGYDLIWRDEGDWPERALSLWRPQPLPGCAGGRLSWFSQE